MLALSNTDLSTAALIAGLIRQRFENTAFPNICSQTISIGVPQANANDTPNSLCTRVDKNALSGEENVKGQGRYFMNLS